MEEWQETIPSLGGVKGLALLFTQLPQAAANSRSTQILSFRLQERMLSL